MKKKALSLMFILGASGFLAACTGGESAPQEESKVDTKQEEVVAEEEEELSVLKLGETYSKDGLDITLNEVKTVEGGKYETSENGKFIVANITVENNTEDEVSISSIMNFELKDADGYSHQPVVLVEGVKSPIDGSIAPGEMSRGEVVYDVSPSGTYELHYTEVFKKGKGRWMFESSEVHGLEGEKAEEKAAEESNKGASDGPKEETTPTGDGSAPTDKADDSKKKEENKE